MIIGGLQKFSLLDYPGHLAAIIFTQGCNFRCHFCYNPMLVGPIEAGKSKNILSSEKPDKKNNKEGRSLIKEEALFDFLEKRRKKLDAVVITGGEPTIHKDLPEFIKKIRSYGFKVKLDTNGTSPSAIKGLIRQGLVDYIAMDVKSAPDKYDLVAGVQPNLDKIKESVKIIAGGRLPHEFRTTVVPKLVGINDIKEIGEIIKGADNWFLQKFRSDIDLVNMSFAGEKPFSREEMEKMRKTALEYVKNCEIR